MKLPLNEPQRRHLGVVLDHVDAALLEVLSGAGGGDADAPQRILRPLHRDVPDTLAPRLLTAAVQARSRLGADIMAIGLHGHPESLRRRMAAFLTSALVLLEDCHSDAMAAYGDVDPALADVLDPWLISLEGDVNALRVLIGAGSEHAPPR